MSLIELSAPKLGYLTLEKHMIFRTHTRFLITPYWYDVGFRGTVRIEMKNDGFWLDVHRDVGNVNEKSNDPARLILVSYLISNPPSTVAAVIEEPHSHHDRVLNRQTRDGFSGFPQEYREFVIHIANRMSDLSTKALNVTFWRTGARGGPAGIKVSPLALFWRHQPEQGEPSRDSEWRQIPSGIVTAELPDISFFDLNESIVHHVTHFLNTGTMQPIGHDLLREAWRIHESNPRAAVVVAIAALETGVKEFLVKQLPQTAWLLHNLPSPPLHKFLRDLLPTVPSKAKGHSTVPALDSSIIRVISKAVEMRNSIVHVGEAEVGDDWLADLFRHARNLLYELDYHSGHEWAAEVAKQVAPWDRTWIDKLADVATAREVSTVINS